MPFQPFQHWLQERCHRHAAAGPYYGGKGKGGKSGKTESKTSIYNTDPPTRRQTMTQTKPKKMIKLPPYKATAAECSGPMPEEGSGRGGGISTVMAGDGDDDVSNVITPCDAVQLPMGSSSAFEAFVSSSGSGSDDDSLSSSDGGFRYKRSIELFGSAGRALTPARGKSSLTLNNCPARAAHDEICPSVQLTVDGHSPVTVRDTVRL